MTYARGGILVHMDMSINNPETMEKLSKAATKFFCDESWGKYEISETLVQHLFLLGLDAYTR